MSHSATVKNVESTGVGKRINGALVKLPGEATVYLVIDGESSALSNLDLFKKGTHITDVTDLGKVNGTLTPAELIKDDRATIYLLDTLSHKKRPISADVFSLYNFNPEVVRVLTRLEIDSIPTGAPVPGRH